MITWRPLPTSWNDRMQWTPNDDDREFAEGVVFFSRPDQKWRVNNLPKLGRHDSPDDAKRAYETYVEAKGG